MRCSNEFGEAATSDAFIGGVHEARERERGLDMMAVCQS
jgi:hypothetical protein